MLDFYVDDLLIVCQDMLEIYWLKTKLIIEFQINDRPCPEDSWNEDSEIKKKK